MDIDIFEVRCPPGKRSIVRCRHCGVEALLMDDHTTLRHRIDCAATTPEGRGLIKKAVERPNEFLEELERA